MLEKKITSFFEKYNISTTGKKLCVCFSGGSDSVALISSLYNMREKHGFSLCAVHVNHHIRGEEADGDMAFCEEFCQIREIPFFAFHVYAVEEAEKLGISLETAARKLRYGVFEELKLAQKVDYFLTAHHAKDSAETVIFNILRGCSVSGLMGIPPVRGNYLRPLIDCSKEEIMVFLSENNLPYVTDSTNSNEDYTRNYIRHSLLPAFEKVNSNYSAAIKRLSQSASTDEDYFSKELDKITSETKLDSLHPAISSRYICKEYEKLSGGEGLGAVHVRQILSCLSSEEEKRMDLPFGIKAFVKNGKVIFIGKEINSPISAKEVFFLSEGVNVFCGNVRVFIENVPSDSKGESESESKKIQRFSDSPLQIVIDRDKIKGELYARRRSDGDKLKTRGINRAVSKELMNAKVPKHTRAFIPVICDADGIVFVPFVGAEDRVFTKGHAEHPVRIKVEIDL